MKYKTQEFRNMLLALRPGLNNKEFTSQSCHFIFYKDLSATFNDLVCITHPFNGDVQFSVKGEEFFKIIDSIPDEELTITVEEKRILVTSASTKAKMPRLNEELAVLYNRVKDMLKGMTDWKPLPKDFVEAISLCAFAASPDLTKNSGACVCTVDEYCVATDGQRASVFLMDDVVPDRLKIIAKDALELSKFPVVEYCQTEKWNHFRTQDGVTFSRGDVEGEFTKLDKILDFMSVMDDKLEVKLPNNLKEMISGVTVLATDILDKSGKFLSITIKDDELSLSASGDQGEIEKVAACEYKGEPIIFNINNKFFSQVLEKATTLKFFQNYLYFNSGNFHHILMTYNPNVIGG